MNTNCITALEKALAERRVLLEMPPQETNCFRLFNGAKEGIPGLVIEQFADVIVIQVFELDCQLNDEDLKSLAEWLLFKRKVRSVYKKVFVKDRSQQTAGSEYYSPKPLLGKTSPSELVVSENGLSFEIQPFSGYSTGLFLDQRDNRKFLRDWSTGKQVLNLFAYTCGFSVVCASGGAATTSVDLSKKYLEWGKRNFDRNGLDVAAHGFFAQDTFEFLKRSQKKGITYDLVIVDPPSFSRTKAGGVFSLKKDLERLLQAIVPIVSNAGGIFFSCNFSEWDSTGLQRKSVQVLMKCGNWQWQTTPRPPKDFENAGNALSQWMAVKL